MELFHWLFQNSQVVQCIFTCQKKDDESLLSTILIGLPNPETFPLQGSMTAVADDSEEHLQQISVVDVDVVVCSQGLLVTPIEDPSGFSVRLLFRYIFCKIDPLQQTNVQTFQVAIDTCSTKPLGSWQPYPHMIPFTLTVYSCITFAGFMNF